ncbi:hypothetical protein DV738_g502, partial [Chaetothyriales sp. CBS 135597]
MAAVAAAELLGAGLLGEVQEENVQDPQPRDVLGCERIDRLLELFRYPSISSSYAGQEAHWTADSDVDDNLKDDITPKQRPAVIQLSSRSSSSFQSSPGKTSLLYFLTALCLLPPVHGGKGSAAVWIDTDARFSAQHLSRVMRSILRGRIQEQVNESTDLNTAQEIESTVSSSLAQLHVIKPTSSSALLTSLAQLPTHLLSSSASFNLPIGIIILDSANAFHYQDRQASELARLSSYPSMAGPSTATSTHSPLTPPTSESVITALKAIQSIFDCTLAFTTRTTVPSSSAHRSFSMSNNQHPTSLWTSFADLTLHLTRLPIPTFPHSMTLDDCLRDKRRRQQALATGRVRVSVDLDSAGPARRNQLKGTAGAGFVIRANRPGDRALLPTLSKPQINPKSDLSDLSDLNPVSSSKMSSAPRYTTVPTYSSKILVRGTPDYERCRRNNPTADTADRYPQEIHVVESPEDVVVALKRATELGVHVGVRSSGHIMNLPMIHQDGILIDTVNLNRSVDYNPKTHEICFGPSIRVEEVEGALRKVKRFFPHGHAPTVGAGGFLLAGGQGWFVRGWGATNETWINKIEIVVPDGRVLIASAEENEDLFWAARGSGLAFFGVITRFWCATIRPSIMWERTFKFDIRDKYEALMTFFIERGRDTPRYRTDLNLTIDYPEKYDPAYTTDDIPPNRTLHMTLNLLCYTDTIREARTLLSAWDRMPPAVRECLIEARPIEERTFQEVFARKRGFLGNAGKDRWQINSIINHPDVHTARLVEGIKPCMLDLPTRTSSVFMCFVDIYPDEKETCISLPQELYISTITGWTDPKLEPAIYQPMRNHYRNAFSVANGQYITELDVNNEDANCKVLTDTALARLLEIRAKYDPNELFPNYKKFVQTHDKINKLEAQAKL